MEASPPHYVAPLLQELCYASARVDSFPHPIFRTKITPSVAVHQRYMKPVHGLHGNVWALGDHLFSSRWGICGLINTVESDSS